MAAVCLSDGKTVFLTGRSCVKSALWVLLCAVVQAGCVAVGVGYEGNERFRQEFPIVATERAAFNIGPTTFAELLPKWWVNRIVKKEDFLIVPIPILLVVPVGWKEFSVEFT